MDSLRPERDRARLPRTRTLAGGVCAHIRRAQETDAERCLSYLSRVGGESDFLSFGEGEFDKSLDDERAIISRIKDSDNGIFIIAEVEQEIVGMLTFEGGSRPRTRHAGEFGISIAKAFWGNGLGREMIEALIEWAEANPVIRKLNLRVRVDNERAIRLYRSLGFVEEGVITRDLLVGGRLYDNLLMGRAV